MNSTSQNSLESISDATVSSEITVLCLAARKQQTDITKAALQKLFIRPFGWNHFLCVARHHRVTALIYKTLQNLEPQTVPKEILQSLKMECYARVLFNQMLVQQLIEIVAGLKQAGILAIPFKGPSLAQMAYGDIALRTYADLDLWVSYQTFADTIEWLKTQGFQVVSSLQWECQMVHPETSVNLDLHHSITPSKFPFKLTFEQAKAHLSYQPLAGQLLPQLSPEDMLLVQCIGWCKDCWGRSALLGQLCDVAELLQSQPTLQWQSLLERTQQLDSLGMMLLTLATAHEWLGAPLPTEILNLIQESAQVSALQIYLNNQFWQYNSHENSLTQPLSTRDHVFYFGLRLSLWARLSYIVRLVITPTNKEKQIINVPVWLSFVHIPLRLIRLSQKYSAFLINYKARDT